MSWGFNLNEYFLWYNKKGHTDRFKGLFISTRPSWQLMIDSNILYETTKAIYSDNIPFSVLLHGQFWAI